MFKDSYAISTWYSLGKKLEEENIERVLKKLREHYLPVYEFNDPGHCGVILDFLNVLVLDLEINNSFEYLKTALLIFCGCGPEECNLFYDVYMIKERFKIKDYMLANNRIDIFSIEELVKISSCSLNCSEDIFFEFLFSAPSVSSNVLHQISDTTNQWNLLANNNRNTKKEVSLNLSVFLLKYDILCSLLKFGNQESNIKKCKKEFNDSFQTMILNEKFYKVFKVLKDPSLKQIFIDCLIEFGAIDYIDFYYFLYTVKNSRSINIVNLLDSFPDNKYIKWLQYFDISNIVYHFKLFDRLFIDFEVNTIQENEHKFLKLQSFLLDEFAEENVFLRATRSSKSLWLQYQKEPLSLEKKLISSKTFEERKASSVLLNDFINGVFINDEATIEKNPPNIQVRRPKEDSLVDSHSKTKFDITEINQNKINLLTPLRFKVDDMNNELGEPFSFDNNINKFIQNMFITVAISEEQVQINKKQITTIKEAFEKQKRSKIPTNTRNTHFNNTKLFKRKEKVIIESEVLELDEIERKKSDYELQNLLNSFFPLHNIANPRVNLSNSEGNKLFEDSPEPLEEQLSLDKKNMHFKNKRIKTESDETPKYKYYLTLEKQSNLHEMFITPDKLLHAILQLNPSLKDDLEL